MSEWSFEQWEVQLQATARAFPYPRTPDVAGAVRRRLETEGQENVARRRRLAWAAVAIVLVAASLLAVPQVRAAVLDFLRVGAIRILIAEPTPTAQPPAPPAAVPVTATAASPGAAPLPSPTPVHVAAPPAVNVSPTGAPRPSPTFVPSALDLAGETTLAEAQAGASFAIRVPGYPAGLGPPDRVFLQEFGGPVVILAWLDPTNPARMRLVLYELGPGTFGEKVRPRVIRETTVDGRPAVWAEGPYILQLRSGDRDLRRLVEGHVLIWAEGQITYRLETDLSLDESVRIAESLH